MCAAELLSTEDIRLGSTKGSDSNCAVLPFPVGMNVFKASMAHLCGLSVASEAYGAQWHFKAIGEGLADACKVCIFTMFSWCPAVPRVLVSLAHSPLCLLACSGMAYNSQRTDAIYGKGAVRKNAVDTHRG